MSRQVLAGTLKQRTNVTGVAGWDLKTEDQCHGKVQAGTLKQRTNVTGVAGWDLTTEDQCHGRCWMD